MKKYFSRALLLLGGLLIAASCDEDRDSNPYLQEPTTFVLNTPSLTEQYVQLTESNTVNLTWSQPDYGYNALATYMVQVGISANGTITWNEKTDGEGNVVPAYLNTEYTQCNVNLSGKEIAEALCAIDGVTDDALYEDMGYREVAIRVTSVIKTSAKEVVPGSTIVSNAVFFKHVAGFCAIKSAACIYLIGDCGGWTAPVEENAKALADWRLFETAEGSNVFMGSKNIPAGKFQLRFYTELTGWDGDASIGAQKPDEKVVVSLTDDQYQGAIVAPGKGSWEIENFPGGYVTFTVDMKQMIVTFKYTGDTPEETPTGAIYLVGTPTGWDEPSEANADKYAAWALYSYPSTGEGVYSGTFEIAEGSSFFRFYKALTGWNDDSYGSQVDDAGVDVALTDGVYAGSATAGKGSWNITNWPGGKMKIVVNTNDNNVVFTQVTAN